MTSPSTKSDTPAPTQKDHDAQDKSSVGEEDPGAAVEEMRDPHPDARPPARKPD